MLLGAALLASWMLRRASAATRHLVFTAVMTGVLLLPGAMVTVPRWNVPVLAPDVATSALPSQVPAAATASLPSELPAARRSLARPIVDRAGDAAVSAPTLRDGIDAALALLNMRVMLALFWCALTGILLLRLAIANARLASWERGASVVEDARTLGLLRRLCVQTPALAEALFGSAVLPSLHQYDPGSTFLEAEAGEILLTQPGPVPLIRYNTQTMQPGQERIVVEALRELICSVSRSKRNVCSDASGAVATNA